MKQIKNLTEEIVKQCVDNHFKKTDDCSCDDCRMGIMVIMLNELEQNYVVCGIDEVYAKVNTVSYQSNVDVLIALTKAAKKVRENPRHAGI